jgi:hypothetical protein
MHCVLLVLPGAIYPGGKRVSTLFLEHQGKVVPLHLADSELQLVGNPEYSKTE